LLKCRECGDEINSEAHEGEVICTPCSPNRLLGYGLNESVKLTNLQMRKIQRAAGIATETWLSAAIRDLKQFFQNPIENGSPARAISEAAKNQSLNGIEDLRDFCKKLYKIRFGHEFFGKIEKLRSKPNSRVDHSFYVPYQDDLSDEAGEFYIIIDWPWLPWDSNGRDKYLYISIGPEDSYLHIPSICDESFIFSGSEINPEIYELILKIEYYRNYIAKIRHTRRSYISWSGDGFARILRTKIHIIFYGKRIRYFFDGEIEHFRSEMIHHYRELCENLKKKLKREQLEKIERGELAYFYKNMRTILD
jgi:hypothetical protein